MKLKQELDRMLDERGRGAAAELARTLDVQPQTIGKWRTGDGPPIGRLVEIAVALDESDPYRLARLTSILDDLPGVEARWSDLPPGRLASEWRRNFGRGRERETFSILDDRYSANPPARQLSDAEQIDLLTRRVDTIEQQLAALLAGNDQFALAADADERPGDDTHRHRPAPEHSDDFGQS